MKVRTTVNIDDNVMMSEQQPRAEIEPLPTFESGGVLVDISDRDALYQAMERR
jgi:hypothetical protein